MARSLASPRWGATAHTPEGSKVPCSAAELTARRNSLPNKTSGQGSDIGSTASSVIARACQSLDGRPPFPRRGRERPCVACR